MSSLRTSRWFGLVVCLGVMFCWSCVTPSAQAQTTITVSTLSPTGTGSLSAAITAANAAPGSIINFSVSGTITLTGTLPQITASMTIQGPTSGPGITISGANTYQVFNVASGTTVGISNLTIANGSDPSGGGIGNTGTLTVTNSTFSGNTADSTGNYGGGGIYNGGTLTVIDSTFSGNSGSGSGGGIYNNAGILTVTNSTFSGNSVGGLGGGIANGGTMTVTNSIFSGNSSTTGGSGIFNGVTTFTENHNLFYNNTYGPGITTDSTDITGKNPDLLPFAYYGGPTETMLPLPTSPAICAGTATMPAGVTLPTTDQRGFPLKSACVDIGAVQTNYVKATSVSTTYSGMQDVDLTGLTGTVYTTATATISSGAVNLIGPGANKLTLDASKVSVSGGASIVTVGTGSQAAVYGMTLTGGSGQAGGGIHIISGTLTVVDSTVSGNFASSGGGIFNDGGTLAVLNSTISGNFASHDGGGIYNVNSGTLTVTNSTISGNTALGGNAGGIANLGTLTVTNSTISGNTAPGNSGYGGGIANLAGTVTLTNTIVSGNTALAYPDISGSYTKNGGNVVGSSTINLAPLGNYGGPTQTMPPLSGSTALDMGVYQPGEPTTDQRGAPRPSTAGALIDSGAVQITGNPPMIGAVTPHYGLTAGGASVTITGTGLDGSTASNTLVNFGSGNPSNTVTITPATTTPASITAISPPGTAGPVNVTVTNSYGTSATSSNDLFTYETPVTISPISTSSATYGMPYTETFTVSGGTGSYTLANSGTLPSGWTLTPGTAGWTLSGTPTSTTNSDFILTATDNSFSANTTSQTYTIDVEKAAASVTLTSSTANANLNASVTFTAMVTSSTTGTPTGSVEFLDGSTVLGSGPLNSSGTATYTTSSLTAGMHQIMAVYQGDSNFTQATSAPLAQIVTAPDFGLTTNTKSLTLKDGQTGTVMVSLDPVGGFKGSVQFSCSGLPAYAKCTFSPTSLTADGSNTAQTDQMTIATQGPNSGTVAMMTHPGKPDGIMMAGIFWLPGLLFGGFLFWQRKKLTHKYRILLILLVAAATISGAVGCGSSPIHTAPGSSLVTVTATSGSTSHTAIFDLQVTK